jgi:N-acetylglucosamine-6-sulfatase
VLAILRELRRQLPNTEVVVVGVLPLGASASDPQRRDGERYNQLLARWAPAMGAQFVDPGPFFPRFGGPVMPLLVSDGIHPTPLGYELYSIAVMPAILAAVARAQ